MALNVLVTAIGSFASSAVIQSLRGVVDIATIYGCDIYPKEWHHVSQEFDEVFLAPPVSNTMDYMNFITGLIDSKNINLIIPLTDIEVDFFNQHRSHFKDVRVTIGNERFLKIARDKSLLTRFLSENSFPHPFCYSLADIKNAKFPVIGKPINGRSSEGIFILDNPSDLIEGKDFSNYVFQEYIQGEIATIDIVRNEETKEIVLFPRKELLRTKNGAGVTVELFHDEELIELATQISEKLKAHGAFNMEFIRTGSKDFLIDINPRFSAGIGFTRLTGYDIVKNMVRVFNNEVIEGKIDYKNMIAQKHMVDVINKLY